MSSQNNASHDFVLWKFGYNVNDLGLLEEASDNTGLYEVGPSRKLALIGDLVLQNNVYRGGLYTTISKRK